MKRCVLPATVLFVFLSVLGCKQKAMPPISFYSGKSIDNLLAMETADRGNPAVLLALAEAYAGSGDVGASLSYLGKAEKRISAGSAEVRARIYILRSSVDLASAQYANSLKAAQNALKADKQKKTSAAVSLARALNAIGKDEDSRKAYAAIVEATPELMGSPDWAAYIKLVKDSDPKAALAAVIAFQDRLPYEAGTGTVESGLREAMGDFAGAVFAAYKELSYSLSMGFIDDKAVATGLLGVKTTFEARKEKDDVFAALACIELWQKKDYKACVQKLSGMKAVLDPSSFGAWMLGACRLSLSPADLNILKAYAAEERRYASFPEYWKRAAVALAGVDEAGSRAAAERCIALSPSGPNALPARRILTESFGFPKEDPAKMLIKAEVDSIVYKALVSREPSLLSRLLPLLDLPDNPFTMYALGAMKGIAEDATFASGIAALGKGAGKRVAERIAYIVSR